MTVFFYQFDTTEYSPSSFIDALSEDEQKKTRFYQTIPLQNQFIISRGLLRHILGDLLKLAPKEVPLFTNGWGKPHTHGIHFNLSHSGPILVLCLSTDLNVGVDVEKVSPSNWKIEYEDLVFSRKESRVAATMSATERVQYFFSVWTKKEAWLKEIGCGMSADLTELDTESDLRFWHFFPLPVPQPYIACLSTQRRDTHVCHGAYTLRAS